MGDEATAKAVGGGVGVGVEVDDANFAPTPGVGDGGSGRKGYGVVAAEDDWQSVCGEDVCDLAVNGGVGELKGMG